MRSICPISVCKCGAAAGYVNPNDSDNPVQSLTPELIPSYYRDEAQKLTQDIVKTGAEVRVVPSEGRVVLTGNLQCSGVCIRARYRIEQVLNIGFEQGQLQGLQNKLPSPDEVPHEQDLY